MELFPNGKVPCFAGGFWMSYSCEISTIEPQPALTIRSRVGVDELPDTFESSFASLVAYLEELGEDIAGPPFAIYYNVAMDDLDVEMGLPVTKTLPGKGEITAGQIGIAHAASTVHTGPYEEIESAYVALAEWMKENGYEPTGTSYEFYLNDPGTTTPEDLQTMIFLAVKQHEGTMETGLVS
ncbi:MAG TPA: AraC family transcriptional regulator [Deltaproteobacteria bacterium]|nr:AraC family transcriptional regulator [Deltaproteobacteria bacterium]